MTLKSALQDLRETTLALLQLRLAGKIGISGFVAGREGGYRHWGMSLVHGPEPSDRALKAAHARCLAAFLGLRSIHWWKICGNPARRAGSRRKHMFREVRAVE